MPIYRDAFIHGCFYTEMLFTKACFYTQTLTHTHRCFYSEMLLRAATQVLLHRDAFTQRSFCTQTRGCFYTQVPLHINAFTRSFYTHVLLHRKSFDTEHPLHREACAQILLRGFFYAQMHLYRGIFETQTIHRYCYKEEFCTDIFTQRCFYTQALLELGRF